MKFFDRLTRDLIIKLLKSPKLAFLIRSVAKQKYNISIDPSCYLSRNLNIPNNIKIESDVIICSESILTQNLHIKKGSTLQHRSPPFSIVAGSPAQVVDFFPSNYEINTSDQQLSTIALTTLLKYFNFYTVCDIGSGEGLHANEFLKFGKKVTCVDLGKSIYYKKKKTGLEVREEDYLTAVFNEQFDCIWASHVLEHQPNVDNFLRKIHKDLKEGGVLAITVPPLKHEIVGGHVNLFNLGLLLYRLILAGFDCREAHCLKYGYNISIILKKSTINLPELSFDSGDIEKVKDYFPFNAKEGFHGDIQIINWPWKEFD